MLTGCTIWSWLQDRVSSRRHLAEPLFTSWDWSDKRHWLVRCGGVQDPLVTLVSETFLCSSAWSYRTGKWTSSLHSQRDQLNSETETYSLHIWPALRAKRERVQQHLLNKSLEQRLNPQRIVATRLLYCLQYPVPIQVVYKGFSPTHITIAIHGQATTALPPWPPSPSHLVHEQCSMLTQLYDVGSLLSPLARILT